MNKEEIDNKKRMLKDFSEQGQRVFFEEDLELIRDILQELEQKESILDKLTDKLKETIKKERQLMPYLPHKSVSFHYANGREVLAKEILNIIEGEKK